MTLFPYDSGGAVIGHIESCQAHVIDVEIIQLRKKKEKNPYPIDSKPRKAKQKEPNLIESHTYVKSPPSSVTDQLAAALIDFRA